MNAEEAFVRTFVVPERRRRYIELLAKAKSRSKILDHLNHNFDYDPRLARSLPDDLTSVETLLKSKGAPDICHVIADAHELDGQDLLLGDAIERLADHEFAYIIICIPKALAYFQPESPEKRLLLEKNVKY